jgi:predicted GIY-YIG superfamily endonuclease
VSFWVYMLRCFDGSYYSGHTDSLETRLAQHRAGEVAGYTAVRRPLQLVFFQEFTTREAALAAERQIKGWSRAKKEALIEGDWSAISRLAQRRTSSRRDGNALREPQGELKKSHSD